MNLAFRYIPFNIMPIAWRLSAASKNKCVMSERLICYQRLPRESLGIIPMDMVGIPHGVLAQSGRLFAPAKTTFLFMTGPHMRDLAAIPPAFDSDLCSAMFLISSTNQ